MYSISEIKEFRVHYMNRFRNRGIEGTLEDRPDQTKEGVRLEERIKEQESALRNTRQELYVAERAFHAVVAETKVREAKLELNIPQPVEHLLQEVYERAQKCTKLQGQDKSYKHDLPYAYADIRNFVKNGTYGGNRLETRKWNPVFVTYRLLCSAATVLYTDNTNKGMNLCGRVDKARATAWENYKTETTPFLD